VVTLHYANLLTEENTSQFRSASNGVWVNFNFGSSYPSKYLQNPFFLTLYIIRKLLPAKVSVIIISYNLVGIVSLHLNWCSMRINAYY